jgi:hypothetical protein
MQNMGQLAVNSGASPEVVNAIRHASAESGVDFTYMMQKASTESSFNPTAKASTSSASGLYQFIDQTWLTELSEHGAEYGLGKEAAAISVDAAGHASVQDAAMRNHIMALKNDPTAAAEMAAAYTKDNQSTLQQTVGGKIGSTELYLAHFLGAGGATKFLNAMRSNASQSAASVMPEAADANEPVFFHADGSARSLGEVYARFAARFSGNTAVVDTGSASAPNTISGALPLSSYSTANSGSVWPTAMGDPSRASLYEMLVLSQISKTEMPSVSKSTAT